jgi:phasin
MSNSNSNNTDEAVEAVAETFKKVEAGVSELFEGVDMAVPEAVRAIAEKTVTQSREAYETVKDTMEEAVEVLEKSVDQASQGAAALNRKVIGNAQTNLNTSFDLAKDLASAKNIAGIMELQASYARKQFEVLTAQAEEIRTLSTKIATDTTNPLKDHVSQSIDKVMAS